MKSIFVIIFVAFSFNLTAQTTSLDQFFGMKFGSSRDSIKKAMSLKSSFKFDLKESDGDYLQYLGGEFAGRASHSMVFIFVNNKFHTGKVFFKPTISRDILEMYNSIKSDIDNKYYLSNNTYETYEYPFEKGDLHLELAIKSDKAKFSSYWLFDRPDSKDHSPQNSITLSVLPIMMVYLTYQDGRLINIAIEKDTKKKAKDL